MLPRRKGETSDNTLDDGLLRNAVHKLLDLVGSRMNGQMYAYTEMTVTTNIVRISSISLLATICDACLGGPTLVSSTFI